MGPYSSGVAFAHAPYCYRCPFEQEYPSCGILCARNIQDIIDYCTSNNVAAFIAEPIMGEGGIIVPPKDYFSIAKKILNSNDILFISDEVQSGFGRTGKFFAFEHYNVEPDLVTMAKGIANGFPISACTTRTDIGDSFEPGDHLSTFGGNPVSAAAAIANIQVILKENLPEQAGIKGDFVMKRLNELKEKHDLIGDIRGKGLMIGIELVTDRNKKTPAVNETTKIRDELLKNGVMVGAGGVKGNVLRIQPPLIITKEQLEQVLTLIDKSLSHQS
jgi:4-aminobutyrate aminotransferase-like enzyme